MIIRDGMLDEALLIHNNVAELNSIHSIAYYLNRIASRQYKLLVAEVSGKLAGYKLGYWEDIQNFYSWLGGVLPEYRRFGVAQQLLGTQEAYVREVGGHRICVKSMNKYPGMLILLIKNGYYITNVVPSSSGENKIEFTKSL
ncbi:GNAT family N-acetyltransferase [Zooshikella marina]|uniref:GNAT family N-acetyltransferase n=1 Tax=Zooshikella ganghwensis TaxID=202772 RepID=UPI001BB0D7AB|nr:GNAT family N-acetyltransferase [Zooshikella ganghwensis]MBU2705821.1 GNAT family N-acetyltransferase [Zooshikella ganghwensis]